MKKMITSELLYDKNVATFILQHFYDKNIMFVWEKTVSDKPSKNVLHEKNIPP